MHRTGVHQQVFERYICIVLMHLDHSSPPQPHRRQHIRLVHGGQLFAPSLRRAESDIRHPLDFRHTVDFSIISGVTVALLLTRTKVNSARQFAYEQHIHVFEQVGAQWGVLRQHGIGFHRAQIGEQFKVLANFE